MRFCRLSCLLAVLLSVSAYIPEVVAKNWFNNYQADIKRQAKKLNIPGFAMVYYERGQTPEIVLYGRTHYNGKRISADTVFRLASVSKTFTGMMMDKWQRAYDVDWQTPVSQLMPAPKWQSNFFSQLKLADVVGQSSGFMPNAYDNLIEANYSLERVLSQLSDLEPLCDPGRCYTYQNALFGVLSQYFYTRDTSYHRALQELVFDPLGMQTASVGKGGLLSSESWARPHIAITRSRWRKSSVENDYYRFAPAAGVNASIKDMHRYLQGLLGEFPQIVSDDVVSTITTPRVETKRELYRRGWRGHIKTAHYGLGWRIYNFDGHILNYHGGWVKGYRADVAFSPELGVGFAMLMNAESNLINSATAEFWKGYLSQLEQIPVAAR